MLIEIGTEELPAHYIPPAIQQLGSLVPELLKTSRIAHGAVQVYGSPRRLAVIIGGVAARQAAQERAVRGPSKASSFDAQGQPTPALQGFLRKHGATVKQIAWTGDYAQLTLPASTASITEVLQTLVPGLVKSVNCPKTMRWDDSGLTFARPIRWLVVLYGTTPVRVKIGSLTSGRTTYGHPAAGRKPVTIKAPATYVEQLKQARVLVDQTARRALIERLIATAARKQGGVIAAAALEHGLLDEVVHLTEDPQVLVGSCNKALLTLPPEVVVASMSKHQRVFAVESSKGGRLLPSFILVLDGRPTQPARVRHFAETVLNARLSDAMDFWKQDAKTSLEAKVEQLTGIVFHEKLGTMHDKTQRIIALGEWLARQWQLPDATVQHVRRAALLSKADLVTAMVKEFPSLQGIVGGYYARANGEDAVVAGAIAKHYAPLGEPLAEIVAVADWFDTLTGYFGIGVEPTGSQDPFGLRRCALGIIRVVDERNVAFPMNAIINECVQLWGGRLTGVTVSKLTARLREFFEARLNEYWSDAHPEIRRAVFASSSNLLEYDLQSLKRRIQILTEMDKKNSKELLRAASIIERTANILRGVVLETLGDVDVAKFTEPLEQRLMKVYNDTSQNIQQLIRQGKYREATVTYAEAFAEPVHAFFEKVMVNVPDEAVRRNRLALMRRINELYTAEVADLSQLVIETRLAAGKGTVAIAGRR